MRILSRYILIRFLSWFGLVFFVLILTAAATDLLLNLEDVRDLEGGFGTAVVWVALRLPAEYFRWLIPVAAFAAALFSLGLASQWLEVVAVKAGGISPQRVILPVLGGAAVLSFFTLILNETLVVQAARSLEELSGRSRSPIAFKRGSFWYHSGNSVYNIRSSKPMAQTLLGVSVYERDEQSRLVRSIHADSAKLEEDLMWRFTNATIRHFDPSDVTSAPRFERRDEIVLEISEDPELRALEADPESLSLPDLRQYIESRRKEGESVARFQTIMHQRLAAPLQVLLFVLFAAPLALRAERVRTLATPAVWGVALIVGFVIADGFSSTLAKQGLVSASVAPYVLVAAFGAIGGVLLFRVAR